MIDLRFPDTPLFKKAAIDFLQNMDYLDCGVDFIKPDAPVKNAETTINDNARIETTTSGDTGTPLPVLALDEEPVGDDYICPVTGERLDRENGYPWNGSIHGAKKLKVSRTKEWKLLKGIETRSPGLVAEVRAEFDARRNGTPSQAAVGLAGTAATPDTEKSAPPPPNTVIPSMFAPPAEPPTAIELVEMPESPKFTDIVTYITSHVKANAEYEASVNSVVSKFQLTEISDLLGHPEGVVTSFGQWLVYEWEALNA